MGDVKTCKTCKHWERHSPSDERGWCYRAWARNDNPALDEVLAEGREGNDGCFCPGRDFGCIHHEERSEA